MDKFFLKGQSGIELIIVVGFFAFSFLIFLLVLHQNTASERFENRNTLVQEVALQVQQEINLAVSSADGYSRQFVLSATISGVSYTIDIIDGDTVYIRTDDEKHALSLPVEEVMGDVIIGANYISKVNGVVILNP
ncbi:MAG: hypothetical protein AABX96_01130 [Nanoarchaeota archaeon]